MPDLTDIFGADSRVAVTRGTTRAKDPIGTAAQFVQRDRLNLEGTAEYSITGLGSFNGYFNVRLLLQEDGTARLSLDNGGPPTTGEGTYEYSVKDGRDRLELSLKVWGVKYSVKITAEDEGPRISVSVWPLTFNFTLTRVAS